MAAGARPQLLVAVMLNLGLKTKFHVLGLDLFLVLILYQDQDH